MSQFRDKLSSFREQITQMPGLFFDFFLQMQIQLSILRRHIPAAPHHQDGESDHHAKCAVLFRVRAGEGLIGADRQYTVKQTDTIGTDSGENDPDVVQSCKSAVD